MKIYINDDRTVGGPIYGNFVPYGITKEQRERLKNLISEKTGLASDFFVEYYDENEPDYCISYPVFVETRPNSINSISSTTEDLISDTVICDGKAMTGYVDMVFWHFEVNLCTGNLVACTPSQLSYGNAEIFVRKYIKGASHCEFAYGDYERVLEIAAMYPSKEYGARSTRSMEAYCEFYQTVAKSTNTAYTNARFFFAEGTDFTSLKEKFLAAKDSLPVVEKACEIAGIKGEIRLEGGKVNVYGSLPDNMIMFDNERKGEPIISVYPDKKGGYWISPALCFCNSEEELLRGLCDRRTLNGVCGYGYNSPFRDTENAIDSIQPKRVVRRNTRT